MARIRSIKPEIPQSESMGRVSREARLLFILLWTIIDDEGRARGSSRMLASLLYPYDDDAAKKIEGWLTELERESCVVRYTHENNSYIACVNWLKHQKIDRPSRSRLPPPREASREIASDSGILAADLGPRIIGSISISSSKPPHGDFEGFWNLCPKKVGKAVARKAYAKAIQRTSAAVLDEAMRRYAASRVGEDEKFTAHPSTWLNADRWLDEAAKANGAGQLDATAQALVEIADQENENLKRLGVI